MNLLSLITSFLGYIVSWLFGKSNQKNVTNEDEIKYANESAKIDVSPDRPKSHLVKLWADKIKQSGK